MFKIIALTVACLVVATSANYWGGVGYGYQADHGHHDYYSHPSYKFEYGVKDPHTGDHKSQWEHRDGDVVKGSYTLEEADGTHRVVEYSSDKHNGFQAHVKRVGHAYHPQVYGHQGGYHGGYNGGYSHGAGYSYSKLDHTVSVHQCKPCRSVLLVVPLSSVVHKAKPYQAMLPITSVALMLVAVTSAYVTGNGYKIVTKHSSHYFDNGANTLDASYQPSGIGSGYSEGGLIGYKSSQDAGAGYPENGYDYKDYYTYPKYKFDYGVQDAHTGDHKSQWEIRDGDVVKGGYTLYDADGTKRIVEYTSDKHHGFNAVVKKVGHAVHPQVYKTEHGISGGGYDHAEGYSYSNINQHL
ncbi:uncharacterized protein LOC118464582 [Anopheles albimanus]|uniref:uncharacterized protein LOC118464582 n=1 Tax=Anopheles albimanus TaxID=7167 RepID=UPI001640919F|nr:uncharacterized protein LOC118464582 [Anopheles albimanus]